MSARLSPKGVSQQPYLDTPRAGESTSADSSYHHIVTKLGRFKHLLCFILPVTTLSFLVTGLLPSNGVHGLSTVLIWTIPFWLVLFVDWNSQQVKLETATVHSQAYYDGILYLLTSLQLVNIICMVMYISQLRWETANDIFISLTNLVAIRFLVGTSSGTSGIVVAHELIHRPQQSWQVLGRLLLCTVCYDHFVVTHKRGHHLNLGMPDDIATAKLNESFKDYWRRVSVGYFRYAWRSEQDRLAAASNRVGLIHNQVLHGLLVEVTLLLLIWVYFGWLAAIIFLYQAVIAVRILEAVNYFQHWGLENGQFGNTYGWVSHSWLSRYALIGLSHHIGHHEDETKHFHEIAYSEQGPNMPYGYFVMNLWVKLGNASYQQMAVRELGRYQYSQD